MLCWSFETFDNVDNFEYKETIPRLSQHVWSLYCDQCPCCRSNPLFTDVQEKDYYSVVSLSSGYYSTYRRGGDGEWEKEREGAVMKFWDVHISVSQYEEVPEDSLCYTSNPNHFVNSLSRTSDQMPDLQNAANVIFNKQLNGSDSCNWYLLKKFGDNTSNFSTYKPSIHRASAIFNGARIEGII